MCPKNLGGNFVEISRRVLLQGVIFDIGHFGLVVTSANRGGAGTFSEEKRQVQRGKMMAKFLSQIRAFSETNAWEPAKLKNTIISHPAP